MPKSTGPKKKNVKKIPNSKSVSKKKKNSGTEDLEMVDRSPDVYISRLRNKQGYMPIGDHFEELRWRLMRSLIWVGGFSIIAFVFFDPLWQLVMQPVGELIAGSAKHGINVKIINTELPHAFLVHLRVVVTVGLILAVPIIVFEMWGFVLPALDQAFRRMGHMLLFGALLLFWTGLSCARYFIWPMVTKFLIYEWMLPPLKIVTDTGVQMIKTDLFLTVDKYLSFFFAFHLGFGIAFELPIISVILGLMGIITSKLFLQVWRYAIIVIAVLSAMITPPDVFSMFAMMLPLIALYFISAFLVFLVERKKTANI